MSRPRFEDGTTGRPLGDDEDLDGRAYAVEVEVEDRWDDMAPEERRAAALGASTGRVGLVTRTVRAVVVHADGRVVDEQMPDTLETWQGIVGGYLEHVALTPGCHLYCNEEGTLDGLPRNELATLAVAHLRPELGHQLCGDVVFLGGTPAGNEGSCPKSVADLVARLAAELAR